MSLIREALKKADHGKEPEILVSDKNGKRKRPRSFRLIQYGVLFFLLLGLAGSLAYYYFLGSTPLKTLPGRPAPLAPIAKVEKMPPGIIAIAPPPTPPKESKETKEKELAKKSETFLKAPVARLFSPRPTAQKVPKPSLEPKSVTKAKPPSEIPEPSPAQKSSEELDSLFIVRLFNEAVQNQEKGLYPQAIQKYQEILAERPNHWETYNNLGLIYQTQKQYTRSLELFQKALSLNPRYLKGYNNLGLLYLTLGKLEEAGNQFRKALELDPQFIPAYINLAVAYKRQGQVEKARKTLQSALDHDAESLEAHYNLGLLWEQEGVENKAIEHYQKFVSKAQGPYGELAHELRKRWPRLK